MSIDIRVSSTATRSAGGSLVGSGTEACTAVTDIDKSFPTGAVRNSFAIAFATSALKVSFLVCDQDITLYTNGTNEVQTLSTTGTVTAGTFTITWSGQTTTALAWNTAAAAVQAALEALSNIAVGDVAVTGGPLPGTPVVITFTGNLGLQNVAAITTTDTLTGGSTAVATTTGGVAPDQTFSMKAGRGFPWQVGDGYYANPFTVDVTKFSVTAATSARLRGIIGTG